MLFAIRCAVEAMATVPLVVGLMGERPRPIARLVPADFAATALLGGTPPVARSNRSAPACTAAVEDPLGNARLEGTRLGEQRLRIA